MPASKKPSKKKLFYLHVQIHTRLGVFAGHINQIPCDDARCERLANPFLRQNFADFTGNPVTLYLADGSVATIPLDLVRDAVTIVKMDPANESSSDT